MPTATLRGRLEELRRHATARIMRNVLRIGAPTTVPLPRTGIHRVLVCRSVHTLGDSLMLTPLLAELAAVYPGAEVDVLCGSPIGPALFGAFENVRNVWSLPRHIVGHPLATARTLHAVRRHHYDLVIDPDAQSQTGRVLALAARATYSLGFVGPCKGGTLTHGVALPAQVLHKARAPVDLLRRSRGEALLVRPYPQPDLPLSDSERTCGRHVLARLSLDGRQPGASGPRVGIFANATRDKRLASAWWNDFITAFTTDVPGCRIIEILPAFGQSLLDDRFACFYSSDVRKLASVLANLDAFVSADCGVMHLAWAAGIPTVGLFCVTDPAEWGPFGAHSGALRFGDPAATARQTTEILGLTAAQLSGVQ